MKKNTDQPPDASYDVAFHQIIKLIPRGVIGRLARETGVQSKARSFSVFSHLGAMIFSQLAYCLSLNDVCDWLRLKARMLARFGMSAPARNTLSHANRERSADFIEGVFWSVLENLQKLSPGFGYGKKGRGSLHRFKAKIHAVDSSVIELVANCMDWAKHRRRKAAAKMHLRLDLHSFLPSFAIVDTAAQHDSRRARELCSGLEAGEIVVFDKAYVDLAHLSELDERGVYWVTRAKDNMSYRVVRNLEKGRQGDIIKDQIVELTGKHKGKRVRRIEAWVEINQERRKMVFITNNTQWSPRTACELYRRRWDIETFFKQVKQTLKISNFLGYSANAVRWQIYSALLVYVLVRFLGHVSKWKSTFARLFAITRCVLWERIALVKLLKSYGTAKERLRVRGNLEQAWLPGIRDSAT